MNNMCSRKWARPSRCGGSERDPTRTFIAAASLSALGSWIKSTLSISVVQQSTRTAQKFRKSKNPSVCGRARTHGGAGGGDDCTTHSFDIVCFLHNINNKVTGLPQRRAEQEHHLFLRRLNLFVDCFLSCQGKGRPGGREVLG